MKYFIIFVLLTSCTKGKDYKCVCRSQQNEIIDTKLINAKTNYDAELDCKRWQSKYNAAGIGFAGTDCSLYN